MALRPRHRLAGQTALTKRTLPVTCDPPSRTSSVAGPSPRMTEPQSQDAIYPTTKLSMINTAKTSASGGHAPAEANIPTEPAEQEARTKKLHAKTRCFVPGSHPADVLAPQIGQFRGKRLNIELGQRVVNSGQKFSSCFRKTRQNRPSTFVSTLFSSATILLRKLTIQVLSRGRQGALSKSAFPKRKSLRD